MKKSKGKSKKNNKRRSKTKNKQTNEETVLTPSVEPEAARKNLTITTFNVENIESNLQYVIADLQNSDILCLQEHHLYDCQLNKIPEMLEEYKSHARGDDYLENLPPIRLPPGKGGVAILWKKHLSPHIKKSELGNNRIICIEIQTLLIINTYMPSGATKTKEFLSCIDLIDTIIADTNKAKSVLLTGDINIDIFKQSYRKDIRSKKMRNLLKNTKW